MNWNAIGAAAELLAAVGVVISILYLAVQVRMARSESRAASIDRLVELWSSYIGAAADSAHLSALISKAYLDYEKLEVNERIQISAHMSRMVRVSEAIYMHHLDRTIDEEVWDGVNSAFVDLINMPMVEKWWPTRRHWFAQDFAVT
jgi:hypothetical protein